nr:MAG TPA: hypothetical protein [Caudoviricetes sp.]
MECNILKFPEKREKPQETTDRETPLPLSELTTEQKQVLL